MASPLAYEEWEITHGDHVVRLRPSLRAAARLERLHDGFAELHRRLIEFDTGIVAAIIRHTATDPNEARAFLRHLDTLPLGTMAIIVLAPLYGVMRALVPAGDPDAKPSPNPSKPMSWAALYSQLFGYGTGWLGWTAAATWNATPNEILTAFASHVEKLKQLHGSPGDEAGKAKAPDPDQAARNIAEGLDPEFDRAGLRALKARIASGG